MKYLTRFLSLANLTKGHELMTHKCMSEIAIYLNYMQYLIRENTQIN